MSLSGGRVELWRRRRRRGYAGITASRPLPPPLRRLGPISQFRNLLSLSPNSFSNLQLLPHLLLLLFPGLIAGLQGCLLQSCDTLLYQLANKVIYQKVNVFKKKGGVIYESTTE